MARYTQRQAAQAWIQAGGPPQLANLMGRIAMREGGGNTHATNHNTNGSIDRGAWQINSVWGPWSQRSYGSLQGSARSAVHVYRTQGLKAWATHVPSIDAKYIGSAPKGGNTGGYRAPTQTSTGQAAQPGSAAGSQLLSSLLSRPLTDYSGGKSHDLALTLQAQRRARPLRGYR